MGGQTFVYKNINHTGHLNNMRLSGKLCDVTIKVNDRKFKAHKIILAANLSYFESMFLNDFLESKQNVTMQGVEGTDLEAFITYAYTGEILLTDTNALNLVEVANYLTEDGIKESCIEFLKENLKKEEACRAYNLANAIECTSLKSIAKQTILSNLRACSLTTEYLSFDFKSLEDIFSSANSHSVQLQSVFFDSLMRWILHDPTSRTARIIDLLNLIDITKLSTDYLWKYFSLKIDKQGSSNIIKDVMSIYNTKSQQILRAEKLEPKLMIVGEINGKPHVQFYSFTEKKWNQPLEIADSKKDWYSKLAIVSNTWYQTSSVDARPEHLGFEQNSKVYLQVLDPASKQCAIVSSYSNLLRDSAMCSSAGMLYLCGGTNMDFFYSRQVLKYDPRTISYKALPPMNTGRGSAAAIFYQGYLHVLGGCVFYEDYDVVEKYDPARDEWMYLPLMQKSRFNFEVAVLNGKLYACGEGCYSKSVEVYDPAKNSWQLVADMNRARYLFLVVAHEGKLLAIGGDKENTVEVYDPSKNQWQIDDEMSSELQIQHPSGGLISSTDT